MALGNPQAAEHIAGEAGTFEPQRQNNFSFEVALTGSDKDVIIASMQAMPLPNESNDEVEIMFQNERRYVAGMYAVDATSMILRDYVDQDTRAAIMRWRGLVYNPNTGQVGLAAEYKKRGNLVMTAPDGTFQRVCTLIGCWPQLVTGGNLAMDSSDQVQLEVNIRFDKALWDDILL